MIDLNLFKAMKLMQLKGRNRIQKFTVLRHKQENKRISTTYGHFKLSLQPLSRHDKSKQQKQMKCL